MTIKDYCEKYLNKPNPTSGRGFWSDDEVAAAERMDPKTVGAMRAFAQSCFVNKITDPAAIQAAWDKAQAAKATPKPPIVQASSQSRKIGDVPEAEFWARLRSMLDT